LKMKDMEAELNETRLASQVLKAVNDGVVVISLDGKLVSVNPAFERITGYSSEGVVGVDVVKLIPRLLKPEDIREVTSNFENFLNGKIPEPRECTIITKKKEEVKALASISFIKNEKGEPLYVVALLKNGL